MRNSCFKWLILLTLAVSSSAFAAQCPTHDFAGFIKEFSTNPEMQRAFTASPVVQQTVEPKGPAYQVVSRPLQTVDSSALLLLAPENDQKPGLSATVQLPNQVYIRDNKGKVLKILTFNHRNCWTLYHIEDWSLEKVLDAQDPSGKLSLAARAFKRGELFNQLGTEIQSPSSAQLYVSALNSYLDGAEQGSAEAAFAAAAISLSGQAPRLENTKILGLLIDASKSVPEAGLALADFYCNEGDSEETRACLNPEKSLDALVTAARSGAPSALIQLGSAYEVGAIVPNDLPRAMACYEEAERGGHEAASSNVERLRKKGITVDTNTHCFKAGRF
ncbi:sel1 repeat family protein [Pseudomonas viridiflava]|uniref:sel1 repeat family protein n=1 Tax=Pseudomonas viridiflava TaxID=33069 RepID=UPI001C2DC885|nr:sel1 repeat family protein [Pseudomonas viridiflava]MBV1813867.1 sel1 repeat family protein [Pseudomonas viridiflava]